MAPSTAWNHEAKRREARGESETGEVDQSGLRSLPAGKKNTDYGRRRTFHPNGNTSDLPFFR